MKKISLILCFATIFMACKKEKTTDTVPTGNSNDTTKVVAVENEWEILFDGTSYDKWRGYQSDSIYAEWTIEDGAMAFIPGEEGGKNIITKEKYTDFILSLDWKVSEGGNSGIFWSVFEDPKFKEAYETGPEIQVLDNEKHPDSNVAGGTHKAGSLYDMIACPDEHVNPAGAWNTCILEVNHTTNMGKVTMNGTEVMTFPVHGEAWDNMVSKSKFKDWKGFGKYRTGHIGLQDHSDKVWFRNIKIKKL